MPDFAARTHDKVAIIGFTQHGVEAPWGDATWAKWGLNDLHEMFEQVQPGIFQTDQVEWFQLHHRGPAGQYPGARDPAHTDWLTKQTCPVWMWQQDPTIPASRAYPIREILTAGLLPHGKPLSEEAYFNNSISWMLALAIARGYKTIGLFGVDMALDGVHGESEYSWQRPSVEYFIGVARGLGIDVVLPAASEVLKSGYLYGWDNSTWARRKFLERHAQLERSEAEAVAAYEQIKKQSFELKGQRWGVDRAVELAALLEQHAAATMEIEPIKACLTRLEALVKDGEEKDTIAQNELGAAVRRLHETRGALNDVKWALRNYFPGDGGVQDVVRGPRAIATETAPFVAPGAVLDIPALAQSDGKGNGHPPTAKGPKNRIRALVKES